MSATKNIVIDTLNKKIDYKNPRYGWKENKRVRPQPTVADLMATSHAQNMQFIKNLCK